MQKAPSRNPAPLFSPIFSGKTEKIGPPEARQKRPRRNESLQARLLILCARFFLSKPQTKFAVWVFLCKSATTSQSRLRRASSPGRGAFSAAAGNQPLRRFAPAPLGGEPFSAAFSSASCRKPARRAAGRKNRPPSPHICPQHAHVLHAAEQKPQNCAHCRRLRPRQRVFCVIFNVLSIKSLNFAGNNARNFIF